MKALTIALLFAASTASAASFDCQVKNLNAIEKAICAVPEISLLDEQMAEAFKAVSHIPGLKLTSVRISKLGMLQHHCLN